MTPAKISTIIGIAIGLLALVGYATDAGNYYEPRAEADASHAAMSSFNELDSITNKVDVLELKIRRIVDIAEIQRRQLTATEQYEIDSLREEIRLLHDRRNDILGKE